MVRLLIAEGAELDPANLAAAVKPQPHMGRGGRRIRVVRGLRIQELMQSCRDRVLSVCEFVLQVLRYLCRIGRPSGWNGATCSIWPGGADRGASQYRQERRHSRKMKCSHSVRLPFPKGSGVWIVVVMRINIALPWPGMVAICLHVNPGWRSPATSLLRQISDECWMGMRCEFFLAVNRPPGLPLPAHAPAPPASDSSRC
jgi:hypothetical protein